jgi:hypothetical protein
MLDTMVNNTSDRIKNYKFKTTIKENNNQIKGNGAYLNELLELLKESQLNEDI